MNENSFNIERIFNASIEKVFEAFTIPHIIEKWWGPDGMTTRVDKFDFRIGGEWKFYLKNPKNKEFPLAGIFSEIDPPNKIVTTDFWELDPSRKNGRSLVYAFESLENNKTKFTLTVVHQTKEDRDHHVKIGVIDGWNSNFDCLDNYFITKQEH